VRTDDLPATPDRTRTITAGDWEEAPPDLPPDAVYRRRIGSWLLWRVGPPKGDDATYYATHREDLSQGVTFRLFPDGTGDGVGPSGTRHARFRTWKEDLRDSP
jgi:hypothetical protein